MASLGHNEINGHIGFGFRNEHHIALYVGDVDHFKDVVGASQYIVIYCKMFVIQKSISN